MQYKNEQEVAKKSLILFGHVWKKKMYKNKIIENNLLRHLAGNFFGIIKINQPPKLLEKYTKYNYQQIKKNQYTVWREKNVKIVSHYGRNIKGSYNFSLYHQVMLRFF